jgi:hypothetical protein
LLFIRQPGRKRSRQVLDAPQHRQAVREYQDHTVIYRKGEAIF